MAQYNTPAPQPFSVPYPTRPSMPPPTSSYPYPSASSPTSSSFPQQRQQIQLPQQLQQQQQQSSAATASFLGRNLWVGVAVKAGEYCLVTTPFLVLYEQAAGGRIPRSSTTTTTSPSGSASSSLVWDLARDNPLARLKGYYQKHSVGRTLAAATVTFAQGNIYWLCKTMSLVFVESRITPIEQLDLLDASILSVVLSHVFASFVTHPLALAAFRVRHSSWDGFSSILPPVSTGAGFLAHMRDQWFPFFLEQFTVPIVRQIANAGYYALLQPLLATLIANEDKPWANAVVHIVLRVINVATIATAGIAHLPLSVTMTKMRMRPRKYRAGIVDCVKRTWRQEGVRGFYRGYSLYLLGHLEWCFPAF